MQNVKIAEMAERFDRIYNVHWEHFHQFALVYYLQNQDKTILDDYNMPHDVKEALLAWGGKNARQYLKEEAPDMGGATLEDLTKTATGIKALKSLLIEITSH